MKYIATLFLPIILVLFLACKGQKNMHMEDNHQYTNELINETSPYLLQHAHNPVNWQAWNEETLQQAKDEDKLLLISIGYAACHWCHVMEHESFEDSTVANWMNENFICVKVDREERPDVDQIYMDACQLITGSGGWPLNAIALPDGRPIFAGTYFPKDNWIKVLEYFATYYPDKKEEAIQRATEITEGIKGNEQVSFSTNPALFNQDLLDLTWENWQGKVDFTRGGRTGAPKFPMPNNWEFLLRQYYHTQNVQLLDACTTTLDNMMMGGIYDHVGGGFARYSTDGIWKVPHFEKMLYDNGQLVSLYAQAYSLTKNEDYRTVVDETLTWIKREMTHKSGGFYSSLDADSEGVEGKFYVFSKTEMEELLGDEAELLNKYWNVKEHGNWEESNILFSSESIAEFSQKNNVDATWFANIVKEAKETLLEAREERIRPGLDDKILTGWNALMLKGYVDAYKAFGTEDYLKIALSNGAFLLNTAKQGDDRINRNYKNGVSSINGFLDDYSFTIEAFIALYEVTFDEQWLLAAKDLTEYVNKHFFDESTGMYFYTSDVDEALIVRKTETSDNVIPSSNSSMAKGLYVLGKYFYDQTYIKKATQMVNNMKDNAVQYGPFYSNWAMAMEMMVYPPYEVAIVGEEVHELRKGLQENYVPNAIYLGGKQEGSLELLEGKLQEDETYIYVCQNRVCKMPVQEVESALSLLKE